MGDFVICVNEVRSKIVSSGGGGGSGSNGSGGGSSCGGGGSSSGKSDRRCSISNFVGVLNLSDFYSQIKFAALRASITTRPDTRHKMRLVCVLFTFENNTGRTDGPTDGHDLL